MEVFKDYAYYYNAFYRDKDYRGEAEKIDILLKKYGKHVKSVLDFGCGTGRHDLELFDLGYQCEGIDISESMIEIARDNLAETGKNIKFTVADIKDFKAEKKYDAVISLFHVVSYQNRNEDVLQVFSSARECLETDGLFIFDVWYGPGVLSDKPSVRVKEIDLGENLLVRVAKPTMHVEKNVTDVHYDVYVIDKQSGIVKQIKETHSMRYFFQPELEMILRQTGFELVDSLDCNSLVSADFGSWTSFFIAKAVS